MSYRICETLETEKQAMRDVYCQTMIDLANQNDRIVVMDADLMNSVGTVPFGEAHPERTVNCGIQEANMIGVAAGMSAVGMVPYCHTFGCFATRRCLDQIFVSAAFAKANIRIIGSDPGITAAMNGATHMPFEDMGSLRDIPGVTHYRAHRLHHAGQCDSPTGEGQRRMIHVRLSRKNAVQIYQPGSTFEIGKAAELRPGTDVTLMATGVCVAEALKAADQLAREGISAAVVNVFTLKPIDRDAVEHYARSTGAIVTAENHSIYNGLGSAVAEVVAETCPVRWSGLGVLDRFGQVGTVDYLREIYQLDAKTIYEKARKAIARKNQ